MEPTQYPYSIKFSAGTIVLLVILMLFILSNVLGVDSSFGWIFGGITAFIFFFLLTTLIARRLIPALKGNIALEFDEEGINDYIRDVSIEWKDIEEIDIRPGRSAATLIIDLKFESDYGSSIAIPLRWVKGKDEEIYDTVLAYFENDKLNHFTG